VSEWQSAAAAEEWDAGAAAHLPTRAEQQAILLELLAADETPGTSLIDLGIGSGLVAEAALDALPNAHLVGVDFSAAMLEKAHERLTRFGGRVDLVLGDLEAPDEIDLPSHRYRAAFSVQALHHLPDTRKTGLIDWIARALQPEGLLVIVDRVRVPEDVFSDWTVVWRRVDPAMSETYEQHLAALAAGGDQPALLEDHLSWLAAAGLAPSCLHLYGNRALIVGRKALEAR
jgi:tRNA (cmo5U34)-methyltransferase